MRKLWLVLFSLILAPIFASADTQFIEDDPAISGRAGTQILCERNDSGAALTSTDLDWGSCSVDSTGAMRTAITGIVPGTSATSLGKAEDQAFVSGDVGVMMLGLRDDSYSLQSGATSQNGDYIPFSLNANGAGRMILDEALQTNHTTMLLKLEDSPATNLDAGIVPLGRRTDTPASSAGTDGDYATLNQDSLGYTYVQPGGPVGTFGAASVAFGSITNSYVTALTDTNKKKLCVFTNSTDKTVAWDDGTTAIISEQLAGTMMALDFATNARTVNTSIRLKYVSGAPASGNASVNCLY